MSTNEYISRSQKKCNFSELTKQVCTDILRGISTQAIINSMPIIIVTCMPTNEVKNVAEILPIIMYIYANIYYFYRVVDIHMLMDFIVARYRTT